MLHNKFYYGLEIRPALNRRVFYLLNIFKNLFRLINFNPGVVIFLIL